MRRFLDTFGQHRILGGAVVLALTQFGASLMGLVRDRALTATFPGLDTVDVYIASFRPSDLLFQMCIMAGLSTVLVPMLARHKSDRDHGEMSKLLSSVMGMGAIVFGVIGLALAAYLPRIAAALVGFEGEALALYVTYARLALLTNVLFVFGNALGQYLVTVQRYWIYGITPILYSLGTVLGTLYLTPAYGPMGPMLGTIGGAAIYVLIRLAGAAHAGFRPRRVLLHPDLLRMGVLMLPRMAALGALQLELLVFDGLASGLPSGAVTINAYARNFQSVVVGVVGIALAQSAFSLLSQAAARGEAARFRIYLRKGVTYILVLTIPAGVVLVLAAPIAASLVKLTSVLPVFTVMLGLYAASIPFESLSHLLLRAFYAMQKTGVPAACNVLNGVAAIAVSALLLPRVGVFALPFGFAAGQVAQTLALAAFLPPARRGSFR